MFMSCEVAFYKLNIYDVNFTNYHHMVESNFKGTNLRKLCEKAILIKCILTLDNSNTHQLNTIETVIRTFDRSNPSNYKFSSHLYNNSFMCHNDHLVSFRAGLIKSKLQFIFISSRSFKNSANLEIYEFYTYR